MASLGRSLAFYLKYPAEMQQLYERSEENPGLGNLAGLDDPDQVLDMVQAVGDAACAEVADFLQECAQKVQERFPTSGHLVARCHNTRNKMERTWWCALRVHPEGQTQAVYLLGISVLRAPAVAVPWVWVRGGRAGEHALAELLRDRVHSRSGGELVTDAGTIALARIPLPPEGHTGFETDRDAVVEQVCQAFERISAVEWEAIASLRESGD